MNPRVRTLTLVGLTAFAAIGCATDQCAMLCEDPAVPQMHPVGAITRAHYDAMEANGEAADFVLHTSEFESNSPELTSAGRDHILEIGARMGGTPFPIIVEPSGANYAVDTQRVQTVTDILTSLGNADATERVMTTRPYSDGIDATEAIHNRSH